MTGRILRRRYKIISELGKGGFGTTYLAVDLDLPDRTKCVVKQLTPSDPRPQVFQIAKELFEKEARTLQRLGEHDRIPRLFAYFEENGQFYLVQEYIEGYDLTKEIYSGNFNENRTVQLLIEILEALKYVHRQNAIHRDLKPQNIMRRKSDGKIVLIDFGAVKEIKGLTITSAGVTTTTIVVGTPGYMPDEQAAGKPKFCSDIYAVGMMGIEALSGLHVSQFPKDRSTGEILWKNQVNVSDEFGRVLERMAFDYWKHRYQGVDDAIAQLREIGSYYGNNPILQATFNPPPTPSPSVTLKVSPTSRRSQNTQSNQSSDKRSGWSYLLGIVVVVLGLGGIFGPSFLNQTTNAKQSEAKAYLGSINKGQQGYFAEYGNFSDNIDSLGIGILQETTNYSYKIKVVNDRFVVSTANAKDKRLRSYSGIVNVYNVGNSKTTRTMLCETDQPSLIAPDDFQNVEQCPYGSSPVER